MNNNEELIKLIKNALTKESDEMEGQQTIELQNIDACAMDAGFVETPLMTPEQIIEMLHLNDPNIEGHINTPGDMSGDAQGDWESPYNKGYSGIVVPEDMDLNKIVQSIIDDDTVGANKAIVEFAQDSVTVEQGVDYTLYIKPGDQLTSQTIIGQVTLNGETKPIRSIFTSGTVEEDIDGSFHQVFKDSCNRHFIVKNYTYGIEDNVIDTEFISQINDKFKNEAQLHQLITDNLCESVLPYILCNRYKFKIPFITRPNGRDIFEDYMKDVQDKRERYSKDMKKLGTEENIKATNGNRRKLNELGNRIIARRYKHYLDIKDLYYIHRETLRPCECDYKYTDCKYLAYLHNMKT